MTSANRFTYDVVANDKASETTQKITGAVQALVPALEAAAAAYERMAASQAKLGIRSSTQSNVGAQAQKDAAAVEKANNQAARSAEASAKATFAAITQRSNAIQQANQKEAEGLRQIEELRARAAAATAREAIAAMQGSAQKMAAIQAEIQRTRELQAERQRAVNAAQTQVAATRVSTPGSALGGFSSTGAGNGEMAARSAAAAVQNLKNAQQALTGASNDVAKAEALMAREVNGANQGFASQAAAIRNAEAQLSSARYALYQVSAGYNAMASAAGNAVKDVAQVAISQQAAFAQVSRTTGLGQDIREGSQVAIAELHNIKTGLQEVATQIPTTFNDLSQVASLGAQLGIAREDIVGFAETVTKFAATTDVTAESTAAYFGRLQNLLDIPATKFENLGSTVAELGVKSVATESEILAVTTQIAAVGTNAGLSAPYVVGLGTAMASLRIAPELARGATTRVFAEISRATADGGEKLAAYANVLGITSEQAAALFKQNPDEFFSRFITSLGKASDSGQNLTGVLDNLGLKNTRDVQVVTRLAQGYQLLGQYTEQAASSFASGTYLNEAFQTIADTTQASLTKMAASFSLLENSIGQSFLAPIKLVADTLNGLFSLLSSAPAVVTAGLVGFVSAVAVFFAFKATLALVTGGLLAFRAATRAMNGEGLTLRSVIKLLNTEIAVAATNSSSAATAMGRHAAATAGLATATGAAVGTTGVLASELEVETVAATTGAGAIGANAAATRGMSAAQITGTATTTGLAASFKSLWLSLGPIGVAFLAIGALVGVISSFASSADDAGTEAAQLAAKQKELNSTWTQAGDGQKALQEALKADTKAYKDAGDSASRLNGVYALITKSSSQLADGTTQIKNTYTDLRTGAERVLDPTNRAAQELNTFGNAIAGATDTAAPAKSAIDAVTGAINDQTVALGPATEAWKKKALAEQLNTAVNTPELRGAADALGVDKITGALKAGLKGGPEAIAAYFHDTTEQIKIGQAALRTQLDAAKKAASLAGIDVKSDPDVIAIQKKVDSLSAQWTLIGTLQQKFSEVDTAIADQAASDELLTVFKTALGDVTGAIDEGTSAADKFAEAVKNAQDAYDQFTQKLFNASNLTGALQNSFETLGEAIANNGTDFSNFTDAGRANLQALQDAVSAFGAIQSANIQSGQITAQQAATNTANFIQQIMFQLSDMGVDTSKLDFLKQYLTGLTGQPYTVQVGANVAPALANLNVLQGAMNNVATGANLIIGAISNAAGIKANLVPLTKNTPNTINAPGTAMLGASLANARATQEAKNLAEAQNKAAKAAKSAGNAQKKAADEASAALKKQQEYVRDLASYYDNLGSKIFGAINSEGDAFKALQSLGQSLVDNGKSFDNVTESGRKNFDALSNVFNSFGKTLGDKINQGVLNADQAAVQYREFAQGIYGELVNLGVSAEGISGIFRALGVDATGWTGNTQSVQQYAGFISAAADAAGGLNDSLKQAEEYSKALSTALGTAFDRFYGLSSAVDKVQSSINDLAKSYQDSIDKVNELRKTNAGLAADLSGALVDKNKAAMEQAISLRYGETGRAADFGAQAQAAGAKAFDIQSQIDANNREAATLEQGRNALIGNTDAAIDNRAALQSLQKVMLDQIAAYAATGHTTQEVTDYTAQLQAQFVQAAQAAGYSAAQVQTYTVAFTNFAAAIRSVPNKLTVTADTSQATNALNAIPKGSTHVTTAIVDRANYDYVKYQLDLIPKQADYKITPSVDAGGAGGVGAAGTAVANAITNSMDSAFNRYLADLATHWAAYIQEIRSYTGQFGTPGRGHFTQFEKGGLVRGYASGGLVPGQPVGHDNILARGPDGLLKIGSGEFVVRQQIVQQPGVLDFLGKLNSGELKGYFAGGGINTQAGVPGQTVVAELAPHDRMLLTRMADAAGRNITLYADGQKLADSADRGNTALARRGAG